MKIHYKEFEITKGEKASKLHAIVNLMKGTEYLFEKVKDEDADEFEKVFGCDEKMVAKGDYIFKLTVEKVKP